MDDFLKVICRVGIFVIFAQMLVNLRPGQTYEKYLKLLVGVMVLIQLLLPIGKLLPGTGRQTITAYLSDIADSLEEEMSRADEEMEEQEAMLEQMTLEEVRKRMEEQEAETAQETEKEQEVETGQETEKEQAAETGQEVQDVPEITVESIEQIVIEGGG
jgi:stage III sporulation protein AF